jgi:hypothetical protein
MKFPDFVRETSQQKPPPSDLPPFMIRGLNFAWAMARWAGSGFKMCSKKQISNRLAICQACPELVDGHCQKCGCACIEENILTNKLALKSESCPIGKWGRLDEEKSDENKRKETGQKGTSEAKRRVVTMFPQYGR